MYTNKNINIMVIIVFIKYLLEFTIVSFIQIFSFIYYIAIAQNVNKKLLALKEGLTAITYIGGLILIVAGYWEIGLIAALSAITFANFYIHKEI